MRAVYMYTAMADLAGEDKDQRLYEACQTLWDNIVKKRMYITGGIGSTVEGEAFTIDYDLPNDMAYAETCASIGMIFFCEENVGDQAAWNLCGYHGAGILQWNHQWYPVRRKTVFLCQSA